MARKMLGQVLLEAGLINEHQLRAALGEQKKVGRLFGRTLVMMGFINEEDMVRGLSAQLKIPAVHLDPEGLRLNPTAKMLSLDFCRQNTCIPFQYTQQGNFLDVAFADPTHGEAIDEIRVRYKCNVRPFLAGPTAIEEAVRYVFLGERPRKSTERLGVVTDPTYVDSFDIRVPSQLQERPIAPQDVDIHDIELETDPSSNHPNDATIAILLQQIATQISDLRQRLQRNEETVEKITEALVRHSLARRDDLNR